MKSKIYSVPEFSLPLQIKGQGQKGLLIVIDDQDQKSNSQTLDGLVKAIKYDIDQDVTIVSAPKNPIEINTIASDDKYQTVILLGLTPERVGFNLIAKPYFYYKMVNYSLLLTDSLTEMNNDKSKKMAFWKNLQDKFLN